MESFHLIKVVVLLTMVLTAAFILHQVMVVVYRGEVLRITQE